MKRGRLRRDRGRTARLASTIVLALGRLPPRWKDSEQDVEQDACERSRLVRQRLTVRRVAGALDVIGTANDGRKQLRGKAFVDSGWLITRLNTSIPDEVRDLAVGKPPRLVPAEWAFIPAGRSHASTLALPRQAHYQRHDRMTAPSDGRSTRCPARHAARYWHSGVHHGARAGGNTVEIAISWLLRGG